MLKLKIYDTYDLTLAKEIQPHASNITDRSIASEGHNPLILAQPGHR